MTAVRYVAVALLAYVLDIGVFAVLVSLFNAELLWSNLAGKICTAIFGFLAHRYFTFQAKTNVTLIPDAVRFGLVVTLNVPFSTFLLYVVVWMLPYALAAKVLADSIGVGVTFLISKLFIFKNDAAAAVYPATIGRLGLRVEAHLL